jgi:hypothetical protein
MSLLDVSAIEMDVQGDVLTLKLGDKALKVKLPRGERGAAGRDGISIKGDKGEQGIQGRDGQAGRDSTVAGERGEKGERGATGVTPFISVGSCVTGDVAHASISGTPENPCLHLVLPRGERGVAGRDGLKGKDGNHEYIQLHYAGSSPHFNNSFISAHCIVDGHLTLPEMKEEDVGSWTYLKTFTDLTVIGLVEGSLRLEKGEGRKFIVISYGGKYQFSAF